MYKAGIYENNNVIVPFVAPTDIISNIPVISVDSLSLKRYTVRRGNAQRWEIRTGLMPYNQGADLLVHNIENNYTKSFNILMPQVKINTNANTPISTETEVTYEAGSKEINIQGITEGQKIAKGEFIQFNNHSKVYILLEDVTVSNPKLKIFPELRVPVTEGLVYYRNFGNVILKAFYNVDTALGITFIDGILADPGVVTFVEDV